MELRNYLVLLPLSTIVIDGIMRLIMRVIPNHIKGTKVFKVSTYIYYLPFEIAGSVLLCYYLIPPCIMFMQNTNAIPILDETVVISTYVVGLFFTVSYVYEMIRNSGMDKMLYLHHMCVVCMFSTVLILTYITQCEDIVALMSFCTAGFMLLHAAIDFIPHMALIIYRMNGRSTLTSALFFFCAYPLLVIRILISGLTIGLTYCFMKVEVLITNYGIAWCAIEGILLTLLLASQVYCAIVFSRLFIKGIDRRISERRECNDEPLSTVICPKSSYPYPVKGNSIGSYGHNP